MRNLLSQSYASQTSPSSNHISLAWKSVKPRLQRAGQSLVPITLALFISACSNEKLLPDANLSGATKSSASAFNVTTDNDKDQAFNPFSGPTTSVKKRIIIENPTMAQVMKPGPFPEMSLGRKDAPVTIIKYASLTCRYCRKFQLEVFPKLKRNYIDTGKVRFIIRGFPIGRSSGNAAIALQCADPSKQFSLYGKFMAQQSSWVSQEVRLDAIYKIAQQVGLSRARFDACLQNQDMIKNLKQVKDRGRMLGVIGTPNFFIQNELVKSVLTYDELSKRIDKLLMAPATSVAATNG